MLLHLKQKLYKTADLRYHEHNVQRNIFAYTFEPSANEPQIHGCPLSLHQDVNVVQMWHLPSLLRIANLVQYQSLLLRKIVQMRYLLHICCNLATLVNPFFRPVV